MKFVVNGKTLKTELDCVSRIIENKSTIPVLEIVLITAKDGAVTLTGTDLDLFMIAPVKHDPLEHFVPGAICVNAKELSKMTSPLTGNVTFEIEGKRLQITAGKVKIKMAIIKAEDFPNVPVIETEPQIVMTGELLRSMVKDTAFAITKEESRFSLSDFKLTTDKKTVKVVTTDGHRLAYTAADKGFECDGKIDTLIPKKALVEAAKMSNCTVSITDDGKDHIRFMSNGRVLISRKLPGNFPNYEMVMPKTNDKTATFDIAVMKDAVKRAAAVVDPRNQIVTMEFGKNECEIASGTMESTRSESIEVAYTGEKITLGFNAKYLSEYLVNAASGKGSLSFKNSHNQVEFMIDGYGYDYRYVLMPLRP